MARREANKGWKIFGICVLAVVIAVGIFCAVVAIGGAVNHLTFVEQFKEWFPFLFKKETAEEAEATISALRTLIRK